MLIQYQDHLTFENLYLWANFGILPFWLLLVFIPNSKITHLLVNSIIFPLLLGSAYVFTIYQIILLDEPILELFTLYQNLDNLYTLFSNEGFLLIFWLHFLAINLFMGTWVSREGSRYAIPRVIIITSLVLIYFTGPVGLVFYWLLRIFYAKKLRLHD